MKFGLLGASGKQGQRWLDPKNHGTHAIVPIARNESVPTGLDGVIVATPAETHLAMVQRVPRGMPLLVEKPLGMNLGEVEQILEHSEIVVPCHTYLWSLAFESFLSKLDRVVRVVWDGPSPMPNRGLDWGPHQASIATLIQQRTGMPAFVGPHMGPAPAAPVRQITAKDNGEVLFDWVSVGPEEPTPMLRMLEGFMGKDPRCEKQITRQIYEQVFMFARMS